MQEVNQNKMNPWEYLDKYISLQMSLETIYQKCAEHLIAHGFIDKETIDKIVRENDNAK